MFQVLKPLLILMLLATSNALKPVINAPLDVISLDDITPEERHQLALFEEKLRLKRSGAGSGDILKVLKNAIGQGIKKKIGQVAKASASASGAFSKSSSSGKSGGSHYYHHYPEYEHEVPESYEHKSIDWWSLKKSIFNTLLQAVKAIKGGVIAVKGQLIKGSGKLLSAKGKLIATKGEAITNLGKNIATSAVLVPFGEHHPSSHGDYGHSGSYSAPSAPEEIYHSAPSAPGPEYHSPPEHYPSHHHYHHPDGKKYHAGLLILKKIHGPDPHQPEAGVYHAAEHPTGPSLGTVVGKFFSASSSLDPHKPQLFGDTAGAETDGEAHEHSQHEHEVPSTGHGAGNSESLQPPSTSYGIPFEKAPSYLDHNLDDHAVSDTKNEPKAVLKPTPTTANNIESGAKPGADYITGLPKLNLDNSPDSSVVNTNQQNSLNIPNPTNGNAFHLQPGPPNYQVQLNPSQPTKINDELSTYQSILHVQQNQMYPTLGGPTIVNPTENFYNNVANLPNIADFPSGFPPSKNSIKPNPSYQNLQNFVSSVNNAILPSPSPFLETPKEILFIPPSNINNKLPSPMKFSLNQNYPKRQTKRPVSSKVPRPTKHNYDVVKSVTYQLGPNGPKRLT